MGSTTYRQSMSADKKIARPAARMLMAFAGLALMAAPYHAQGGDCISSYTKITYDSSVAVNWAITPKPECNVTANGMAIANAISTLLVAGDCGSCMTDTSQDADASSYGPLPRFASASSTEGCGEAGASASLGAVASLNGGISSTTGSTTTIHRCYGPEGCPQLNCIKMGLPGGRATTFMRFDVEPTVGCTSNVFESFLIGVQISVDHTREYSEGNCLVLTAGNGSSDDTGDVNSQDIFGSVAVSWGDSSGVLGGAVYQGFLNNGANGAILNGNLFDDGGPGTFGFPPFPPHCPVGAECGSPYSGTVDLDIPVSIPGEVTWIEVDAITTPVENVGPDINQDGVINFDDRITFTDSLNTSLGTIGFNPYADLNGDLVIDNADAAILDATPCIADMTGDGEVDFFDMTAYLDLYALQDPGADLNADGSLNFFDVSTYLNMLNAGGCLAS